MPKKSYQMSRRDELDEYKNDRILAGLALVTAFWLVVATVTLALR